MDLPWYGHPTLCFKFSDAVAARRTKLPVFLDDSALLSTEKMGLESCLEFQGVWRLLDEQNRWLQENFDNLGQLRQV